MIQTISNLLFFLFFSVFQVFSKMSVYSFKIGKKWKLLLSPKVRLCFIISPFLLLPFVYSLEANCVVIAVVKESLGAFHKQRNLSHWYPLGYDSLVGTPCFGRVIYRMDYFFLKRNKNNLYLHFQKTKKLNTAVCIKMSLINFTIHKLLENFL